jgi:hypothetical protein
VTEPAEGLVTRRSGRAGRLARALTFGLTHGEASAVALAGFLLRGGIVLLALPSVVLPSVIGIAGVTGVDAISIAGQPTPWLIELIALAIVGAVVWLAAASLVGSLTDIWLIQMTLDSGGDGRQGGIPLPKMPLLLRLAAIRMICLVPLAIALSWAATRIFNATYDELTTPSNLASPLPLRVVLAAGDAVAVVTVVWLASETIAAIAVRRELLAGGGVWRSVLGAAGQMVRRPISTLLTAAISHATSAVAIGLALVGISTAFNWCRIAARNPVPIAIKLGIGDFSTTRDFRPVAFALATVAIAVAWFAALAIAAVTSAWRSAAFTNEVADALPATSSRAGGATERSGLGLSVAPGERSGD